MTSATEQTPEPEFEDDLLDELSPGTKLLQGQYTIDSFLNSGGFGITYMAHDSLDRKVVIKECFPSSFCRRSRAIVHARSRAHQGEFHSVVKLFVQEARSLAKLEHPNIVGVHQVFEDNSTAYMALDLIEGRDLLDTLEDENHNLKPDQIKNILVQLLDAVKYIHSLDILHRDISPDNILITPELNPILIDFGAAREEAAKANRVLSALLVVKDGYSPQEFYISGSEQGPSSDLYALGASFYHLIAGKIPPNSQLRLSAMAAQDLDPYEPLLGNVKGYGDAFLSALDRSLKVMPKDRMASAQEWLDLIQGDSDAASETQAVTKGKKDDKNTEIEAIVSELIEENEPAEQDGTVSVDRKAEAFPRLPDAASADGATPPKGKGKLMLLLASVAVVGAVGVGVGMQTGLFSKSDTPQPPVSNTEITSPVTQTAEPAATPTESTTPDVEGDPVQVAVQDSTEEGSQATPPVVDTENTVAGGLDESTKPDVQGVIVLPTALDATNQELAPSSAAKLAQADAIPEMRLPMLEELGAEVAAEHSLPETVLEASTNPPAPVVAPQESTEPTQIAPEVQVVTSVWAVQLPFQPSEAVPNEIGTVKQNAESWMLPGLIILSVNTIQVSAITDIEKMLRKTVELGDSAGIEVIFEVGDTTTGTVGSHTVTLPITQEISVLNGTRFQTTFVDGAWQTRVVANLDQTSSDLKIGDILIADLATSERFTTRDAFAIMINSKVAEGQREFKFIVDRDGSNYFTSLDLSGLGKADTAVEIKE